MIRPITDRWLEEGDKYVYVYDRMMSGNATQGKEAPRNSRCNGRRGGGLSLYCC